MKSTKLISALLAMATTACAGAEEQKQVRNLIPSWGDIALVYGPGTDAAMDTAQAMENMVKHWKGRGFTGVYLRADLDQFPPGHIVRHKGKLQTNPGLAVYWRIVDDIMAKADPHKTVKAAADKFGYEYWLSFPHIYSEGAPEEVGVEGPGRMIPWSYMMKYHQEHPEVITIDREGNKQWMVPEYGYPGMRENKAAEFAHMAKTYQPTGIIASMRSETSQLIDPPAHADQFGFNQVVVDDMKKLYNVDIMTDPRFDWKSASFKSDDEMVQKWRDLRGSYITQLYRDIRKAMREANPKVKFAAGISGEFVGPLMGNARLEWRKWIDEGIVDTLIVGMNFEATWDMDADKKGYLTDLRAGKGVVSIEQVKKYVLASKHPEIQVIATGAPSYFYPPAPQGADGWQCDAWYDSYCVAIYQRWEQWKKDIADFGSIKFFEQNFDGFKVRDGGIAGGMGDGRHHPELRATPGVWYKFGDATDDRPYIQSDVHRGNAGNAIALTGKEITGIHYSSPDRSLMTGQMDTAICNGKARLSYWVYRQTDSNSITAQFTGNAAFESDVRVRVAAKTGQISYINGTNWVETNTFVPLKQWYPIAIELDVDAKVYGVRAGEKQQEIASGIAIAPPKDRFVSQHGVESIQFKVPSYRIFNTLLFIPTEGSKDPIYLDDVLVQWQPTMHYAKPGPKQLAAEDFEKLKFEATKFSSGWRLEDLNSPMPAFTVERTTSYGEGVHCLRATGGGKFVSDLGQQLTPASAKGVVTVDLDLFVRSDKDFPYMMPDPSTRSPHTSLIGLEGVLPDHPFAQVQPVDGTWRMWDGSAFKDTGVSVNYDVWNHLQLIVDARAKTYQLIVQPIGEMPAIAGRAACGASVPQGEKLRFVIAPSKTPEHLSCYDNIVVTGN